MAIKYNGIEIPYFVKVNNIINHILPTISQSSKKINNKDGQIDYGNEIGTRSIQVSITILANDITDLRAKVRELAEWLYYEEAKKLVILEEENIFYMAKATGDSILSEILSIGKATINFICHDPFAYNMMKEITNLCLQNQHLMVLKITETTHVILVWNLNLQTMLMNLVL